MGMKNFLKFVKIKNPPKPTDFTMTFHFFSSSSPKISFLIYLHTPALAISAPIATTLEHLKIFQTATDMKRYLKDIFKKPLKT